MLSSVLMTAMEANMAEKKPGCGEVPQGSNSCLTWEDRRGFSHGVWDRDDLIQDWARHTRWL